MRQVIRTFLYVFAALFFQSQCLATTRPLHAEAGPDMDLTDTFRDSLKGKASGGSGKYKFVWTVASPDPGVEIVSQNPLTGEACVQEYDGTDIHVTRLRLTVTDGTQSASDDVSIKSRADIIYESKPPVLSMDKNGVLKVTLHINKPVTASLNWWLGDSEHPAIDTSWKPTPHGTAHTNTPVLTISGLPSNQEFEIWPSFQDQAGLSGTGDIYEYRYDSSLKSVVWNAFIIPGRPEFPHLLSEDGTEAPLTGTRHYPYSSISELMKNIYPDAGFRINAIIAEGDLIEEVKLKPYVNLYGGFSKKKWFREFDRFKTRLTVPAHSGSRALILTQNNTVDGMWITTGNSYDSQGAKVAVHNYQSKNCVITNNVIYDIPNGRGVAILDGSSDLLVANNLIYNCGEGICVGNNCENIAIRNNTITDSRALGVLLSGKNSTIELRNNIVAYNHLIGGICVQNIPKRLTAEYNDVYGNDVTTEISGSGDWFRAGLRGAFVPPRSNISVPPKFANAENRDYRLLRESQCIDAGSPSMKDAFLPPAQGTNACDMGCFGGPNLGGRQHLPQITDVYYRPGINQVRFGWSGDLPSDAAVYILRNKDSWFDDIPIDDWSPPATCNSGQDGVAAVASSTGGCDTSGASGVTYNYSLIPVLSDGRVLKPHFLPASRGSGPRMYEIISPKARSINVLLTYAEIHPEYLNIVINDDTFPVVYFAPPGEKPTMTFLSTTYGFSETGDVEDGLELYRVKFDPSAAPNDPVRSFSPPIGPHLNDE